MSTSETAREHLAQQRLDKEHLQKNLKERSVEAIDTHEESEVLAEARELATEQRQQVEHRQESMLKRAEEAIEH